MSEERCNHGFVGFCDQCHEDGRHVKKDKLIEELETEVRRLRNGSQCLKEMALNIEYSAEIDVLKAEIDELEGRCDEKEADLEGLRTENERLDRGICRLDDDNFKLRARVTELENALKTKIGACWPDECRLDRLCIPCVERGKLNL